MHKCSSNPRILPHARDRFLAASVTVGLLGAIAGGLAITLPPSAAQADPVKVQAPAVVDFADVVEAVTPGVVSVRVQSTITPVADRRTDLARPFGFDAFPEHHPFRRFFDENRPERRDRGGPQRAPKQGMSQGSGFFISDDGLIVTNNHVVEGGEKFTIVMHDGEELDATLLGTDPRTDLAVLKVHNDREFTYVSFAGAKPRIGEWVIAVGNPFGLGGTVTAGIVSANGREIGSGRYNDFLQIDAAVNRGNSGGPTFNLSGEVVGVNTAIFSPSGGNVGIAFAISAETADLVVRDLVDDGRIVRGWLGVQIQPVSADIAGSVGLSEAAGAMVTMLQHNSPAFAAGLRVGDIILAVEGEEVGDPRHLANIIAGFKPDRRVDIDIWRNGTGEALVVTLGILKPQRQANAAEDITPAEPVDPGEIPQLGLMLVPADTIEPGTDGLAVVDVAPGSAAARKGLRRGDIILQVGQVKVGSVTQADTVVADIRRGGGNLVLLRVRGARGIRFLALPVEPA